MTSFTSNLTPADRIFVSIDVDNLDEAKVLMNQVSGLVTNVKLGLQLATREGWAACVAAAHDRGLQVFCDSKFKDIPNTVEHAVMSMCAHKPDYFTVMADNSLSALQAARNGVDDCPNHKPLIIGVTVLTSIDEAEAQVIYGGEIRTKVKLFGERSLEAGFDAIVCSPQEIELFRADSKFDDILLITPGVRPSWAASNDQSRVMTPVEAIKNGADMLVIGRPITQPPVEIGGTQQAIRQIITEIEEALA